MKALIIGGSRHGEWVDVLDGATAWVNIRTAETHRIRKVTSTITGPAGEVVEARRLNLAVHPELTGQTEPEVVSAALQTLAMNEFARTHGELLETPKEGV